MSKCETSIPCGHRVVFFLTVASVFAVVAMVGRAVNAQCNNYSNGCIYGGATVPCSNISYCYPMPEGWNLACENGTLIKNYKNSNPPGSWANCSQVQSTSPQACKDSYQQCGTPLYFTGDCVDDNQCTAAPTGNGLKFCKAPASGPPACNP